MADEQNAQEQQVSLRIDESKMATTYANTIRTSTTADEAVLDFGFNLPLQGGQGQGPVLQFQIGSRVIMTWPTAKRLVMQLGQAVRGYEERFGEIDLTPQQPQPPQG